MLATMSQAVLIVNPFASEVTEARIDAVERALGARTELTTLRTDRPGHATELVRAAADPDAIFVYSGDGGFNEVVNGVDGGVPIGFIPGGGTSVLPRSLGLPRDAQAAAKQLADAFAAGRSRRISLGRVNGRRFAFSAGLGLDAELVRRVDSLGRAHGGRRPGDIAFTWAAARLLTQRRGRFEPALEIAGFGRGAFALVSNGPAYTFAGPVPLRVTPEARFELGLDLVAPTRIHAWTLPRLLRYALLGRGQTTARDILYGHDLDRIEIVCDRPMPLQADGEDLGDVDRAEFECERQAVTVLC
jgi:diacylglycerol kinase family enzyme